MMATRSRFVWWDASTTNRLDRCYTVRRKAAETGSGAEVLKPNHALPSSTKDTPESGLE